MAKKGQEKGQDDQQNQLDEAVGKTIFLESKVVSLTQEELTGLKAIGKLEEALDHVAGVMATVELIDQKWVQEGLWDLQKGIMCWRRAITQNSLGR